MKEGFKIVHCFALSLWNLNKMIFTFLLYWIMIWVSYPWGKFNNQTLLWNVKIASKPLYYSLWLYAFSDDLLDLDPFTDTGQSLEFYICTQNCQKKLPRGDQRDPLVLKSTSIVQSMSFTPLELTLIGNYFETNLSKAGLSIKTSKLKTWQNNFYQLLPH